MRHPALLVPLLAAGTAHAQYMAYALQDGPCVATIRDLGTPGTIELTPYPGASGGTNVAFGDAAGDGEDDLLTGPGARAANGPHVRAFRLDGTVIAKVSFYAYSTLKYGVNVGGADLDDDATSEDEIVTGPGPQFGPHVRGFKLTPTGMTALGKVNFLAYTGQIPGVRVGGGDFDGDGHEDILTNPPNVGGLRAFSFGTGTIQPLWGSGQTGGLIENAGAGDVDGDQRAELLTAPGPYPVAEPHVRGFEYDGAGGLTAINEVNFYAFQTLRWGANVSSGNLDADAYAEILVTPGPSPAIGNVVRGFNYDDSQITLLFSFFPYPSSQYYGMNHAVSDEVP